jgi:hypothetical protein
MPSFPNLDNRRSSKSLTVKPIRTTQRVPRDCATSFPVLCRLLALLLALAIATPVLLAEEGDHERGNAIDPTGVWLNRANPNPPVILITFHRDGTYLADVQGESAFVPNNHDPGFQITSPTHALWQKTGAKTLAGTSFALQYNDDGSFYGLLKVRVTGVLIDSDHMDLTVSGGVFDLNGNPILNPPFPGGTGHFERLRLEFP